MITIGKNWFKMDASMMGNFKGKTISLNGHFLVKTQN